MILDMGEPVKIVDVAERFAMQHDPPLEIVFTGLRPNEKLHEDLISLDEQRRTQAPRADRARRRAAAAPPTEMWQPAGAVSVDRGDAPRWLNASPRQ